MIDALNFCHIEQVTPGVNVLFYAEHDGDQIVLHQITMAVACSIDIKISMPAEQFEKRWPDQFTFPQAAEKLLSVMQEMGLKPLAGSPKAALPVGSTHEERVALALAMTWSLENIDVEDVKGIMERLAADGYEIRRIGDWRGLRDAAQKVLDAEQDFREQMHPDWDGDPLADAVSALRRELAGQPSRQQNLIGRLERLEREQQNAGRLLSLMQEKPTDRHTLTYTNYRGETSDRELHLARLWYGKTDWHPEQQLFLQAFDYGKDAYRDFAVADFTLESDIPPNENKESGQ